MIDDAFVLFCFENENSEKNEEPGNEGGRVTRDKAYRTYNEFRRLHHNFNESASPTRKRIKGLATMESHKSRNRFFITNHKYQTVSFIKN
jgi:hypothetical protein